MSQNKIRIPDSHKKNFKLLLNLPDENKKELLDFMQNVPLGISNNALLNNAFEKLSLSKKDILDILTIYFNLSAVKLDFNYSDEEFVQNVKESIEDLNDEDLKINEENIKIFKDLFQENSRISNSRKIVSEAVTNINNYESSKIIFNIRPAFNIKNELIGSSIVVDLNINYIEDSESKSFFVSLEESEIDSLMKVLSDGKDKISSIKNKYSSLNIIEIVR